MIERMTFENRIDEARFCSMLSLCKRAGRLVSGETACEIAIKSKKAKLVLLSAEASGNTTKKFSNSTEYYNIPIYTLDFSKEQMGRIIGEAQRSVITIIGGDFAEQLTKFGRKA